MRKTPDYLLVILKKKCDLKKNHNNSLRKYFTEFFGD